MRSVPPVSVIVPAFNAQATLRGCLASLAQLAYPRDRLEVIVVDNASTDATRALAEAAGVRLLCEPVRGRSQARNRGLTAAEGDVIAFTDADCVVEPQWLAQLVEPLADETVGVVGGPFRALRRGSAVERYVEQVNDQEKAICVYQPPYVATANWASPRALLRELGGFDPALPHGHDVDLAWRILQHGRRLVYQAGAIIRHHNIGTLRRLLRQGFQHGYYGVALHKKHAAFLREFGYRRVSSYRSRLVLRCLRDYLAIRSPETGCALTFQSGRLLGKAAASARLRYLDL